MNILDPKTLKIVIGLPPVTVKGDRTALDTEFFHMNENKLHIPHGDFAGLGCTTDGETIYIITDQNDIPEFMRRINEGVHIYHNARFDIMQLRRYTDYPDRVKLWDIMIVEQDMFAGWYSAGEFSLADLSRRHLGLYMDKSVREQFADAKAEVMMTREQIEYLAMDIATTWRVYQKQREQIDENTLSVWKDIDRGAMYSVTHMEGMKIDKAEWTKLYEFNVSEAEKIRGRYEGINLGSWQQVMKELKNQGYTKLKSTNEKALTPITGECEFARDVLEYRGRVKSAGTYGISWLEEHTEPNGRIYSDFYVCGAATGRFSSSKPNSENIPTRDGPQFRKCFIPAQGNILVDADFSAQEPRIWAYLAQDELMIDAFKQGKDIYIEVGRLMFEWELTKKDPRRKNRMKPTVLGAIYGLTEYGMEIQYQIPKDEGKELMNTFWKTFPDSRRYADEMRKQRDYVETVYGRKYHLNYYQKGFENNCLNSPVQGTAADITKLSGYRFQQAVRKAGYERYVWLVNYVHDELLVECREDLRDWTMQTLEHVMKTTAEETHDGVPAEIEVGWGYNWSEAHA